MPVRTSFEKVSGQIYGRLARRGARDGASVLGVAVHERDYSQVLYEAEAVTTPSQIWRSPCSMRANSRAGGIGTSIIVPGPPFLRDGLLDDIPTRNTSWQQSVLAGWRPACRRRWNRPPNPRPRSSGPRYQSAHADTM
jgi:hypothetical protein